MDKIPFALIAVFTDQLENYKGNTAAVVLLQEAWSDAKMQQLAADMNQPATTFLLPAKEMNHYSVRWFAPDAEIGLCGHGSLASIAFLFHNRNIKAPLTFEYGSGTVTGQVLDHQNGSISFKAIPITSEIPVPESLPEALGIPVQAYFKTPNKDIVLVEKESLVKTMFPDFYLLRKLKPFGYIITAPGNVVDFVSRTIIPHVQQLEDPATGSSHVVLAPFWAERLKKTKFKAHQLSKRGGTIKCDIHEDDVSLIGQFQILAQGEILNNYN
ncbi:MAG: PhzF family phenazine biosynthesis protein [Bacteroidota bacterium]|nr:PhzF family phenazine biosynthesis protein [Bacteroidota bacterium]